MRHKSILLARRRAQGALLVEKVFAMGAFVLLAAIVYTLLNAGTFLYARVYRVNATHQTARSGMDHIVRFIEEADEQPVLINGNGDELPPIDAPSGPYHDGVARAAENWLPSQGVKFRRFIRREKVTEAAASNSKTLRFTTTGSLPASVNDFISIGAPSIYGKIRSIAGDGAVTLGGELGAFASPPPTNVIQNYVPRDTVVSIYRYSALIAVPRDSTNEEMELRYYPDHMTVTNPAFNNPGSFRVLAKNIRGNNAGDKPFSYTGDPTLVPHTCDDRYRALRVNLQIRCKEYDQRIADGMGNLFVVNTAVSWKSAAPAPSGKSSPVVPPPPPTARPPTPTPRGKPITPTPTPAPD